MKFDPVKYLKPPTIELAKKGDVITDERAELRMISAWHEAGHFVAAVACSADIFGVNILPIHGSHVSYCSSTFRMKTLGEVRAECSDDWHNSILDLAGRAITERTSGPETIWSHDDKSAKARPNHEEALQEARRFVTEHYKLIQITATHFLMHSRKNDGALNWKRQWELVAYLRPLLIGTVRSSPSLMI